MNPQDTATATDSDQSIVVPEPSPAADLVVDGKGTEAPPVKKTTKQKSSAGSIVKDTIELVVVTLGLLILIRWGLAEARYIPSSSMEPTLQINDRILVEKVSGHLGAPISRGDILVFYPPPTQMPGGKDLSNDPLTVFGRLTGLPLLPNEPAYIKRVIGLPLDRIRVRKGLGVFVNDVLLPEADYMKEAPSYDLNVLGDIGGRTENGFIKPYGDRNEEIVVPAGHLFMMGDNRNNSADSHVWGFLDQKRVIGKAWLLFWRHLEAPDYPRSLETMPGQD
ncbi:MAG: signal peptidase I [Candidatus Obscuribacterales bacterium]|nr:signal peptidase I [Candidatus Obscuribacterales bacterium]